MHKNQADQSKNHAADHKKWPLLVRSLSDSAKYANSKIIPKQQATETKSLTLSLSDSRLFRLKKVCCSSSSGDNNILFLDILSDKDPDTCSCGCDQDVDIEDFSEDEGCFVITSVPQSNTTKQQEVTNKVRNSAVASSRTHLKKKPGSMPKTFA